MRVDRKKVRWAGRWERWVGLACRNALMEVYRRLINRLVYTKWVPAYAARPQHYVVLIPCGKLLSYPIALTHDTLCIYTHCHHMAHR